MKLGTELDIFVGKDTKLVFQEPGDTRPKALNGTIISVENGLMVFKSPQGMGCVKTDCIIAIKPLSKPVERGD